MFRSGLAVEACPGLWAIMSKLSFDAGELWGEVPPLGSANVSGATLPMSVPCGGMNGAKGFGILDEDVAIAWTGWIAPLLPLPCGNGSNGGVVPIVVLIVVDVIDVGLCNDMMIRFGSFVPAITNALRRK